MYKKHNQRKINLRNPQSRVHEVAHPALISNVNLKIWKIIKTIRALMY